MKSCGVSLPAAASAATRSIGVAGNDDEKMASAKATEIEKDFPKLTAQEKDCLAGIDRLDICFGVYSLSGPLGELIFVLHAQIQKNIKNKNKSQAIVCTPASPK